MDAYIRNINFYKFYLYAIRDINGQRSMLEKVKTQMLRLQKKKKEIYIFIIKKRCCKEIHKVSKLCYIDKKTLPDILLI